MPIWSIFQAIETAEGEDKALLDGASTTNFFQPYCSISLKLLVNKSLEAILPQGPISHQFIIQINFPDKKEQQQLDKASLPQQLPGDHKHWALGKAIRYPEFQGDTHSFMSHPHLANGSFTSNYFLFYLILKVLTVTLFLSYLNPSSLLFPVVPFTSLWAQLFPVPFLEEQICGLPHPPPALSLTHFSPSPK